MTLQTIKKNTVKVLEASGSPSASLDTDCLLQFFLKKDKTFILTHHDLELSETQISDFNALVQKRKTGFPIAYITGVKEFFGYDFFVTPDVLIPKPDTEILVEDAVNEIMEFYNAKINLKDNISSNGYLNNKDIADNFRVIKIADICSGSGCIGLSVLKSLEEKITDKNIFDLTMTDLSDKALEVTKKNAESLFEKDFSKIKFLNGDLLCGQSGFDFILSNPPYVPHEMTEDLLRDGRSEPRLALDGDKDCGKYCGEEQKRDERNSTCKNNFDLKEVPFNTNDGLAIIRRLIPLAYDALNDGGSFLMECGEYQTRKVKLLFEDAGFSDVKILCDLSGQERVVKGCKG
ncbi:MAG: peptide chain release factor N(5)-glutamine methyltransferase [Treponema sp.]|nr:peptide chain release factor N(5)-glutamine methyltransferase [Candidatus Treponema merdequi]